MSKIETEMTKSGRPLPPPLAATAKPVLYQDPVDKLFANYISGVIPGAAIGLAGQQTDDLSVPAIVAVNDELAVFVAKSKALEFLERHAGRLLVPSDPGCFMELQGFDREAWVDASDHREPTPGKPFVNLPLLRWVLRLKNERVLPEPFGFMAQKLAFGKGAGGVEKDALQRLLEAGLASAMHKR